MRRAFLPLIIVTGAFIVSGLWLRGRNDRTEVEPQAARESAQAIQEEAASVPSTDSAATSHPAANPSTRPPAVPELTGDALAQKIEQVDALAEVNDATSISNLIVEIQHPQREVRAAAIRAAVQLGERALVPPLRRLATNTVDTAEEIQANEAAEFLELPTMTELRRRKDQASGATNVLPERRRR